MQNICLCNHAYLTPYLHWTQPARCDTTKGNRNALEPIIILHFVHIGCRAKTGCHVASRLSNPVWTRCNVALNKKLGQQCMFLKSPSLTIYFNESIGLLCNRSNRSPCCLCLVLFFMLWPSFTLFLHIQRCWTLHGALDQNRQLMHEAQAPLNRPMNRVPKHKTQAVLSFCAFLYCFT